MSRPESFLRRWSRLKLQSELPVPVSQPAAEVSDSDAELSAVLAPDVERGVRQAALRKLFMSERYCVMDGLDVYVDDYSKLEVLSAEAVGKLVHAAALLSTNELEQDTVTDPSDTPELPK